MLKWLIRLILGAAAFGAAAFGVVALTAI